MAISLCFPLKPRFRKDGNRRRATGTERLKKARLHETTDFIGQNGDSAWRNRGEENGRSVGIRTPDPLIKSQLLYQLSYAPVEKKQNGASEGS